MKFGSSTAEAKKEPARGGGGGSDFMKYLKDGDNYLHIADEPDKWIWYWEHYNPNGFPFPCTNDTDTCPGCTSELEKMKSVSRRVALNAFDGQYTNVWKLPKTVADKLENRFERLGTITDRPYIITRMKSGTGDRAKYDFDLEGQDKQQLPESVADFLRDPEEFLASAYREAWGDDGDGKTSSKVEIREKTAEVRQKIALAKAEPEQPESSFQETKEGDKPPFEPAEEKVITESELRDMDPALLRNLCKEEGFGSPPKTLKTTDAIVDWMLAQG